MLICHLYIFFGEVCVLKSLAYFFNQIVFGLCFFHLFLDLGFVFFFFFGGQLLES